MSDCSTEQGWAEAGSHMRQGAAGLLYPAVPLLKMGCEDVGLCIALGMDQGGSLHDALCVCQVPLLQVTSVPGPELCTTEPTPSNQLTQT